MNLYLLVAAQVANHHANNSRRSASVGSTPPPALFDVTVDVSATLAANAAALEGKPVYAQLMRTWRDAAQPHLTPDGRVAIGVLANFLEGQHSDATLSGAFLHCECFRYSWDSSFGLRAPI